MTPELLKAHRHDGVYRALAATLDQVRTAGVPPAWNSLTVTSLHKRGSAAVAANYRGIAVMATWPKLMAQVLLGRLQAVAETQALRAPTQAGFRPGARLEDNVVML